MTLHRLDLLVLPESPILMFAAVVEPLQAANRALGRPIFGWRVLSADGKAPTTTGGVSVPPDGRLGPAGIPLFVLAGPRAQSHATSALIRAVAAAARGRPEVAGIDGGAWVLAHAGLLDDHRATTHWEDREAFEDRFPKVRYAPQRYVADRGRLTAAGVLPTVELMLHWIARRRGMPLAIDVAKLLAYRAPSEEEAAAQPAPTTGLGRDRRVAAALEAMETHLADPLSLPQIADIAGVGPRRLAALFQDEVGATPQSHYLDLRLGLGRRLMLETSKPVGDVAEACGFNSAAAFARAYRLRYGEPPASTRKSVTPSRPEPAGTDAEG